jgi:nucleoside-diphosphate-sugar epimerase
MILVTGGTGLVGAHLLYKLVSNNESVRAIYRTQRKLEHTKNVFSCYTKNAQVLFDKIEWVKADILDIPALNDAFQNIDYVYHCAAFVSFEPDKYQQLRRANIDGTANIVNLCIANTIKKLCYVSSIATIGKTLKNKPITEETHWNPEEDNSVYAITKYGAEMEVWRGTQEGLNTVIVNPGVIIGAGIWHYGSGSIFKKVDKGLKHYTSGSVGLIAVSDVVAIMIRLQNSDIINERYILVAENWSYKTFLRSIASSLNAKSATKLAKPWLLQLGWRLDWLTSKLTGKRRTLSKQLAKSLITESNYANSKITTTLNFKFRAIEDVILETGNLYLKQAR